MYYVNSIPSKSGDYGNPMGQPFPDCVILPDELLSAYIEAKGFVIPTVKNGVMQSLEVNQEALDAYNKEYPEWEPEPTETEKLQAEVAHLKAQNELQAQHQTFLEDCLLEMGSIVYA
ncbi:MAG: hypothetical protein KH050_05865 [Clostridiaceae bacterium]|nr:hypothetical protein [Clostridiaceae bacterium]